MGLGWGKKGLDWVRKDIKEGGGGGVVGLLLECVLCVRYTQGRKEEASKESQSW